MWCFCCKATKFWPLASMMLPFAVYDQPAHPDNVIEDYDEFLGFRMCDLSMLLLWNPQNLGCWHWLRSLCCLWPTCSPWSCQQWWWWLPWVGRVLEVWSFHVLVAKPIQFRPLALTTLPVCPTHSDRSISLAKGFHVSIDSHLNLQQDYVNGGFTLWLGEVLIRSEFHKTTSHRP